MTRTEVRDELNGIQYLIETIQNKFRNLINEDCVNPSFRTRLHKANDHLSEATDQMHFANHIIDFMDAVNSPQSE